MRRFRRNSPYKQICSEWLQYQKDMGIDQAIKVKLPKILATEDEESAHQLLQF